MSLLELQRRMAQDVRRPLTADFEMQRVTDEGEPMEALAASYVAPNAQLSSFERLEIYNRQYWFRVIGAVSEDFPTLNAVLGAKRFDALIVAYLKETASRSWTLRDLGARLPEFLEAHPEYSGRRHRMAVDVAHLEWAYIVAFDGLSSPPLGPEDLGHLGPDSKLSLQSHLQLLALEYPVDELVLTVRHQTVEAESASNAAMARTARKRTVLPRIGRRKNFLAVHRFEGSVHYREIDRELYLLLSALREGYSIASAIENAFKRSRMEPEAQSEYMQYCFGLAAQLGWLCLRKTAVSC